MERLTENVLGNIQLKACGNDFCKEVCAEHDEEKSCNNCPIQKAFEKLAEYEDLEEQGKLLKLPAAMGEEVFFIYRDCPKDFKKEYCTDYKGSCEKCHYMRTEILSKIFSLNDIPTMDKFFGTQEEAEAALKEL